MAVKNSKALVVDLINTDNPTTYTPDMLIFDPVVALPPEHESLREVSVLISAAPNSNRKGSRTIYYNRLDLGIIPEQYLGTDVIEIPDTALVTPDDVIAAINETYAMELSGDDVSIAEYDPETGFPADFDLLTLIAQDGSYAFKGSVGVRVSDTLIDLSTEIVNINLNGLTWPDVETIDAGETVTVDDTTLPEQFTNGNGRMLVGTGNLSEGFVITANDEISLGVTARLRASGGIYPIEDGLVTLPVDHNDAASDWTIPFSVGLLGTAAGQKITDLYDVRLRFESDNDVLVFALVDDAVTPNKLNWAAQGDAGNYLITDNYVSESGDIVQNIQRFSFYKEEFANTPISANGVVMGNLYITMEASQKGIPAKMISATIAVNVPQPE